MSRVKQRRLEISKNGGDYEAMSAFNTALDAFIKVVEVEEAHVLDNAPDFIKEDHLDSHIDEDEDYATDKYHLEVEKKIKAKKSFLEESEKWMDIELSIIQKIEHYLSAIYTEYTKLKTMTM